MQAIVKEGAAVGVQTLPRPEPATGQVLIRVVCAGLCRTDVHVARGRLRGRDPLILGHEMAGAVSALGSGVKRLRVGQTVTVMPFENCAGCGPGPTPCAHAAQLGVDRHGVFADYIAADAASVFAVDAPFEHAVFAEPVAAVTGILQLDLPPDTLVYGSGRIARLVQRVISTAGHRALPTHDPLESLADDSAEMIIGTLANDQAIAAMLRAVRPHGTIVLRSRPTRPVAVDIALAVKKNITFKSVGHGPIDHAIALIERGDLALSDLIGQTFSLDAFDAAFDAAERSEHHKHLFAP